MAFVENKGGTKRQRVVVRIRSTRDTKAQRRQELAEFKRGLRALAKTYTGKIEEEKDLPVPRKKKR